MRIGEQKISYLIIGNGIAGVTAAEILRTENPQASIGVIADDSSPVYYRPALKDYLSGHVPTEKLWAKPASFYPDAHISFLSDRAIGLDNDTHTVLLQTQKQIQYHKLLLANGASPARLQCPGNTLRGVTTLRTVTDYQNVLARIGGETGISTALHSVRRVVVSGSGTLALETVESLRQRGLEVTHLLRRSTLWSEVLDATASDLVLQEERRAGVEVCLEEEIVKITGRNGEVSGVKTNRGRRIPCQMVLIAIGIEPNIKPWQISGVTCGRGVQVDEALRTNLPDVYAAGDLIETRDRWTNRTRLLGQWYPAIQQARTAAYSMLGRAEEVEPFRSDTFYNATFLYGLDFASVGLTITPNQSGYQALVADPEPQSYRKVILKDGIPVGLLALGNRKQALALKRAIDHRVNLLPIANRLFSADFDLRTWLDQQGVPPPILAVGSKQARSSSFQTLPAQSAEKKAVTGPIEVRMGTNVLPGEKTQRPIISGEQIGREEIMVNNTGQTQGSVPTDCEALLTHIVDPAVSLHIAETPLNKTDVLRIGREAGVHLLLNEGSVSRKHAEISYAGERYLLTDLGSTNGTFINEQRLDVSRPHVLQPNDVLRFGNIVRLKFLLRVLSYRSSIQSADHQDNSRDFDEVKAHQEQRTTGQAVLNRDGTLSTPGNAKPVPASIVQELKNAPALVIVPEGIPPQVHILNPNKRTTIGREEDNDIVLTDLTVSRYHAEVFLELDGFHVRNLSNTYGTLVNQTKVSETCRLSHSDRIKLGSTRIFFIDLQAGKELTVKSIGVSREAIRALASSQQSLGQAERPQTQSVAGSTIRILSNTTAPQANVLICPRCGTANVRVARFCASCSTML